MNPRYTTFQLLFGFIFSGLVTLGGLAGIVFFDRFQVSQHYRIATFQPAPARIVSSSVRTIHGGGSHPSTTYAAEVSYTYVVDGKQYRSNTLLPLKQRYSTSNRDWADGIVKQYPRGKETTAYYSPANPADAFLYREEEFVPGIFALAVFGIFAGGWMLMGRAVNSFRGIIAPARDGSGWFKVSPEQTMGSKFRHYLILAILWWAYWIAVVGDYFVANTYRFDGFCIIASLICAGIGLFPAVMAWRYFQLRHDYLDAEISINHDRIHPGDSISIRLKQPVLRPLTIGQLTLGMICILREEVQVGGKTSIQTRQCWHQLNPVVEGRTFNTASSISGQTDVAVPSTANPTGKTTRRPYPDYEWFIQMEIKADGQPDLKVRFPILMQPAAGAPMGAQLDRA